MTSRPPIQTGVHPTLQQDSLAQNPGLTVIGTNTDAGKTVVSAAILAWSRQHSLPAFPTKPVESGAHPLPQDATRLLTAANLRQTDLPKVCPFPLADPVAPIYAGTPQPRRNPCAFTSDQGTFKARPARPHRDRWRIAMPPLNRLHRRGYGDRRKPSCPSGRSQQTRCHERRGPNCSRVAAPSASLDGNPLERPGLTTGSTRKRRIPSVPEKC